MPHAARLPEPVSPELTGDTEFARVLRICDPRAALAAPLTFRPGATATRQSWLAAWQRWREAIFEPILAPALATAAVYAQQGHAREMAALNGELTGRLSLDAAAASAAAGNHLLQSLCKSRGERWLARFAAGIAARDGGAGAQFAIVYAGQSAFFHLPLRLLLPTYAYWEWSAALAVCKLNDAAPIFTADAAEWQQLVAATLPPSMSGFSNPLPNAGLAS